MLNNKRFDLSDWLIHFFRHVDLDGASSVPMPEHMGFENLYESSKLSPFFLLRCALRQGKLWATWSLRNGNRTIYGNDPAACFTEMPIAAFSKRHMNHRVTQLGIFQGSS